MKIKYFKTISSVIFLLVFFVGIAGAVFAGEIKLRMGTTWVPALTTLYGADVNFVKIINTLCKGEVKIRLYSAGEVVSAFETFGAVQANTLQLGGDVPFYWVGKNTAFGPLGALPMGINQMDFIDWIYQGGGFELYNEIYGKFGLVYFPYNVLPPESGIRGKKKITNVQDYKGMKIRMAGQIQGKILKDLGAAPVMISATEIYQALERGMIDGAEGGGPTLDLMIGLDEVTTEWNGPGWHQPSSVGGVMMNKKVWDKLSPTIQAKFKYAAMANMLWATTNTNNADYDNAEKFAERKIGVNILDDESLAKIEQLAYKHFEDEAESNPLFAKVVYSQYEYYKKTKLYKQIQQGILNRPVTTPNMAKLKAAAEKAK